MTLLLDTNVLLWWLGAHKRLSATARNAIVDAELVYVSAVSAWEIGIKVSLGELEFEGDLEEHVQRNRFRPLPVALSHAIAASRLPQHHKDLFDRMLVAQARTERLTLLTADAALKAYDVPVLLV